jgi:hypothetical protein
MAGAEIEIDLALRQGDHFEAQTDSDDDDGGTETTLAASPSGRAGFARAAV